MHISPQEPVHTCRLIMAAMPRDFLNEDGRTTRGEATHCGRCQRKLEGLHQAEDNPDGTWVQYGAFNIETMKVTSVESVCLPCSRDGIARFQIRGQKAGTTTV